MDFNIRSGNEKKLNTNSRRLLFLRRRGRQPFVADRRPRHFRERRGGGGRPLHDHRSEARRRDLDAAAAGGAPVSVDLAGAQRSRRSKGVHSRSARGGAGSSRNGILIRQLFFAF